MIRFGSWILVGLITFAAGLWTVYEYNHRDDRSVVQRPLFSQLPITGFSEITSARDGQVVSTIGFIDAKVLCGKNDRQTCETYLVGDSTDGDALPIRIRFCGLDVQTNCIVPFAEPVDFRKVFVYDKEGEAIDFDGTVLIAEPNTWTSKSQALKITGRVTVVDGIGRFIQPIEKIELPPDI